MKKSKKSKKFKFKSIGLPKIDKTVLEEYTKLAFNKELTEEEISYSGHKLFMNHIDSGNTTVIIDWIDKSDLGFGFNAKHPITDCFIFILKNNLQNCTAEEVKILYKLMTGENNA